MKNNDNNITFSEICQDSEWDMMRCEYILYILLFYVVIISVNYDMNEISDK